MKTISDFRFQISHHCKRNEAIKFTVYCLLFTVCVACNGGHDIAKKRNGVHPPTAESSALATDVLNYTPAPGQFIGETASGFTGAETTPQAACEYAHTRLAAGEYVSLGGFGGYIIVKFDHSVEAWNDAKGDFTIAGNQFQGSSEPGIVWVMSDDNGDGLPNETWYELRGAYPTTKNYAVTYHRTDPVQWTDSDGNSGIIERISAHTQASYYPAWITAESYTLTGSRLAPRDFTDEQGKYNTGDYGWGYVDNWGSDMGLGKRTRFFIKNAVCPDGSPANLKAIDFVKIQTALNIQGGGIGENSTEVLEIKDVNL